MKHGRSDFVLVDNTGVHWPGALPWRGVTSRHGYRTREEAQARANRIRRHYNAKHGCGGPDLRVFERHGS